DRGETARLVQGSKRSQCLQRGKGLAGDHDRAEKITSAMDDAMSDGGKSVSAKILFDPGEYIEEQALALARARGSALLEQLVARSVGDDDARCLFLLVEQAPASKLGVGLRDIEQTELDAGGAGIEQQDGIGHAGLFHFRRGALPQSPVSRGVAPPALSGQTQLRICGISSPCSRT